MKNLIGVNQIQDLIDKMEVFEKEFLPGTPERNEYEKYFFPFKFKIMEELAMFFYNTLIRNGFELQVSEIQFALEYFITTEEYEKCKILQDYLNKRSAPVNQNQDSHIKSN